MMAIIPAFSGFSIGLSWDSEGPSRFMFSLPLALSILISRSALGDYFCKLCLYVRVHDHHAVSSRSLRWFLVHVSILGAVAEAHQERVLVPQRGDAERPWTCEVSNSGFPTVQRGRLSHARNVGKRRTSLGLDQRGRAWPD